MDTSDQAKGDGKEETLIDIFRNSSNETCHCRKAYSMQDRNDWRAMRRAYREQRRANRRAFRNIRRSYRYNYRYYRGRRSFIGIILFVLAVIIAVRIWELFFPFLLVVLIGSILFMIWRSRGGSLFWMNQNANYQQPPQADQPNQYYQPPLGGQPDQYYQPPMQEGNPHMSDTTAYQSYDQGYQPDESRAPQAQLYQGYTPPTPEQYETPQAEYPQEMPPMS